MKLSTQAISTFKEIYCHQFKKQLKDDDANELGLLLLTFFKLIYSPIPKKAMQVLPENLPMYEL
ncbi:hypothetical protein KBC79_00060 [Candidatus Woesebacteria bacterium]|nr:hypothetical protein [Candidatus Woesebacteria bacterium]